MNVAVLTQPWWIKPPVEPTPVDPVPVDPPPATDTVAMGEIPIPMANFFSSSKPWRGTITDWTPYDDASFHLTGQAWTPVPPDKTVSRAWIEYLCNQMGFDPVTGAWTGKQAKTQAWMGASNPMYIVPADQPKRRMFLDPGSYGTVGAGDFDALLQRGVPIPLDAVTENQWAVDPIAGNPPPSSGSLRLNVYDGTTLLGTTPVLNFNAGVAVLDNALEAIFLARKKADGSPYYPANMANTKGVSLNYGGGLVIVFQLPYRIALEPVENTTNPPLRVHGKGDRWVNVYQPGTDSLWELFRVTASERGGPLDMVGWGGAIIGRVSQHSGTYEYRKEPDGTVTGGSRWGGNATSTANVPFLDMDVLADVLATGDRDAVYPTALPFSLGHAQGTPKKNVWPATRGDGIEGKVIGANAIPEGARIAFPPTTAVMNWIDTHVRPEFRPVALAGVYHGIIPRDKTGTGCNLQMRSTSRVGSTKNRGKEVLTLYATAPSDAAWQYMKSLPWHLAVVVHPDQSR